MGTYGLGIGEFMEKFEEFLQGLEGEVSAEVMAKAWNKLADKNYWVDKLKVDEIWNK